jgi:hypothetical protein
LIFVIQPVKLVAFAAFIFSELKARHYTDEETGHK